MTEENLVVREKVTVTIESELVKWIDEQIKEKRFRNRSHAFELALHKLRKEKNEK